MRNICHRIYFAKKYTNQLFFCVFCNTTNCNQCKCPIQKKENCFVAFFVAGCTEKTRIYLYSLLQLCRGLVKHLFNSKPHHSSSSSSNSLSISSICTMSPASLSVGVMFIISSSSFSSKKFSTTLFSSQITNEAPCS